MLPSPLCSSPVISNFSAFLSIISLLNASSFSFSLSLFLLSALQHSLNFIIHQPQIFLKPSLPPPSVTITPTFPLANCFFLISTSRTGCCVRCKVAYSFLRPALSNAGKRKVLKGGRSWWWCWWRTTGTDLFSKRYLVICFSFSLFFSLLFSRERKMEHPPPRWPLLIKEIFHQRLTSLSTMLGQDVSPFTSHPNKPQLPEGDLYLCRGGDAQRCTVPFMCHSK